MQLPLEPWLQMQQRRQYPGNPSEANANLTVITQTSPAGFELFGFGLTALEQLKEETLRHGV